MNYRKYYDLLISTRLKSQVERLVILKNRKKLIGNDKLSLQLFHNHHIIPKCLGGTNDKSYIINNTRTSFCSYIIMENASN